jgi:hypothetical protein
MKTLFTALVVVLLMLSVPCQSNANPWRDANTAVSEGPWWLDDVMHIGAGALVAYGVGKVAPCDGWCRIGLQIAIPLAIGAAKELTDLHPDPNDLIGWGVGAVGVVLLEW